MNAFELRNEVLGLVSRYRTANHDEQPNQRALVEDLNAKFEELAKADPRLDIVASLIFSWGSPEGFSSEHDCFYKDFPALDPERGTGRKFFIQDRIGYRATAAAILLVLDRGAGK